MSAARDTTTVQTTSHNECLFGSITLTSTALESAVLYLRARCTAMHEGLELGGARGMDETTKTAAGFMFLNLGEPCRGAPVLYVSMMRVDNYMSSSSWHWFASSFYIMVSIYAI